MPARHSCPVPQIPRQEERMEFAVRRGARPQPCRAARRGRAACKAAIYAANLRVHLRDRTLEPAESGVLRCRRARVPRDAVIACAGQVRREPSRWPMRPDGGHQPNPAAAGRGRSATEAAAAMPATVRRRSLGSRRIRCQRRARSAARLDRPWLPLVRRAIARLAAPRRPAAPPPPCAQASSAAAGKDRPAPRSSRSAASPGSPS